MTPWFHQSRSDSELQARLDAGARRVMYTAPTGAGKTWNIETLIERHLNARVGVSLYSNRRLLIDQLSDAMVAARLPHGVRMAGEEHDLDALFQISSVQTEQSRVLKRGTWDLHNAGLVIIDEAHCQTGDGARELMKRHIDAGAAIVGFTATPLGLQDLYDELIVGATVSECMDCGALVPAMHFGPDEPDMIALKSARKAIEGQDLTEKQAVKAMGARPQLFGRIWENFQRLNPDHRPTICFGPDVASSIWIAEQFTQAGVRSAHIDGTDIWLDGELQSSSPELRQYVLDLHRKGDIALLSNRFVLREGIDLPWIRHVIAATIFGSLQSCLQALGRGLRADNYPDTVGRWGAKTHVTIQDHGGSYWRHGSLNSDREWHLDDTAEMVYALRADRIRDGRERAPVRCPKCSLIWGGGSYCNPAHGGCGYSMTEREKKGRPVVTTEGELRLTHQDYFPKRAICRQPNGPEMWEQMYYRARSEKWNATFREAIGLFAYENHTWPDPSWPMMPQSERDKWLRVSDVPPDRLIPKEGKQSA